MVMEMMQSIRKCLSLDYSVRIIILKKFTLSCKESDEKNKRIMKELLTFFIPKYTKLEPKK